MRLSLPEMMNPSDLGSSLDGKRELRVELFPAVAHACCLVTGCFMHASQCLQALTQSAPKADTDMLTAGLIFLQVCTDTSRTNVARSTVPKIMSQVSAKLFSTKLPAASHSNRQAILQGKLSISPEC